VGLGEERAERLAAMHQRSGLQFGSDPREFDVLGLPKYGADLSDDDQERASAAAAVLGADGRYSDRHLRPGLDAVAYDSELDNSD
jgi:hypothetical protein